MTCIVALKDGDNIWMGGDAGASSGYHTQSTIAPKVFGINDNILIGYTSSFRMGQLLQFHTLAHSDEFDLMYMVKEFVPSIRKLFKDEGYARVDNNEEYAGRFIVVSRGRIFEVNSDYAVLEYHDDFYSVGSGSSYALGALHAMRHERSSEAKVLMALETAAHFTNTVKPPFTVLSI